MLEQRDNERELVDSFIAFLMTSKAYSTDVLRPSFKLAMPDGSSVDVDLVVGEPNFPHILAIFQFGGDPSLLESKEVRLQLLNSVSGLGSVRKAAYLVGPAKRVKERFTIYQVFDVDRFQEIIEDSFPTYQELLSMPTAPWAGNLENSPRSSEAEAGGTGQLSTTVTAPKSPIIGRGEGIVVGKATLQSALGSKPSSDTKNPPLGDDSPAPSSIPPTRPLYSESISDHSVSDQPASQDSLGFTPYVEGVAQFLLNDRTKAPLTLSIEGEWGSGKTSFMEMLRRALCNGGKIPATGQELTNNRTKTVWFNAWRHDKNEELWAAFALTFMEEMAAGRGRWKNFQASFRLNWERVSDWGGIVWESFRFAAVATIWMIIAGAILIQVLTGNGGLSEVLEQVTGKKLLPRDLTWLFTGSSVLGILVFAFMAVRRVDELVGNPFKQDFKKYLDAPDYADRISFLEHFHRDFNKVVQAYQDGKKVFVFIDDLDRCEVPKAAELMQAINLMISEAAPIFFIIGMDREKVAAGLAAKFEKLLPYLMPGSVKADQSKLVVVGGLEYGLGFIEKFIQLPFRVPVPAQKNLISLFHEMRGPDSAPAAKTTGSAPAGPGGSATNAAPSGPPGTATTAAASSTPKMPKPPVEFEFKVAQDSVLVQKLMEMVAPGLDYNPRRIKQFVNTFRLNAYIAYNTGLFQPDTDLPASLGITLPQLAKYVAISLRWPRFISDLADDPELLKRLVGDQTTPQTDRSKEWRERPRFYNLLCYEPGKSEGDALVWEKDYLSDQPEAFRMGDIKVQRLLRVSPPSIRKPTEAPGSESSEGRINSPGDLSEPKPVWL